LILFGLTNYQLRGYRTILANTPARPAHNNWADQILGLDTPGHDFGGQSLEDEVRTYLMEGAYHLGSVRYWEVFNSFFLAAFKR
jgi:hypothetical protein